MSQTGTILVVEDDLYWRQEFLVEPLQEAGLTVWAASNYRRATELFDQHPIDLLIIDINLTGVDGNTDGISLIQYALARRQVKIVVVSGSPERMYKYVKGIETDALIEKDRFDVIQFVQTIQQILSTRSRS